MKFEEKRAREEKAHKDWLFQLLLSSQQPRYPLVPHIPTHWYYNQSPSLYQSHDAYHETETNDGQQLHVSIMKLYEYCD